LTARRGDRARLRVLAATLALALAGLAAPAAAQLGASLSLASDYRLRGLSLSNRKPALSVNLSYDTASGVYFGASAIGADTAHSGLQLIGHQEYVGYAGRTGSGPDWDVGVSNASYTEYFRRRYALNYTEVYAGLTSSNLSAHVYYSPDYLGEGVATLYVGVDGAIHPAPRWRLFGHLGVLSPLDARGGASIRRPQFDLRVGAATTFRRCEFQLAWTHAGPDADYPAEHAQVRDALVLSATYNF
jgi:uncharacterized protein (TIGR02001 family)